MQLISLVFILFLSLSACSGNLKGQVFLDLNGDNNKNDDEPRLASLAFTVTKEDKDVSEGTTDANGKFSVSVKDQGTYCVEITEVDLISSSVVAVDTLVMNKNSNLRWQVSGESNCTNNTDDDADGTVDCNDTDCASNSACASDNTNTNDNSNTNTNTNDNTSDNTNTNDNSATDTSTVESGKACKEYKGGDVDFKVPIAKDYSVDDLQAEDAVTANPGERISNVVIKFPNSCEFNLFSLPEGLTSVDFSDAAYDSTRRKVNFNTAIAESPSNVSTSQSKTIADDNISTFTFPLDVNSNLLEEQSITMAPTMECPDNNTITLKTFTINVDTDDLFTVSDSQAGNSTAGATVVITTTVTNNSTVAYTNDEVKLVLTVANASSSTLPADAVCTTSSNTSTCKFALAAGSSQSFQTSITLPQPTNSSVTVTLGETLTVTRGGKTLTEEKSWTATIS